MKITIQICMCFLLVFLYSCQEANNNSQKTKDQTPTEQNKEKEQKTAQADLNAKATDENKSQSKLVGIWDFGHEPASKHFKADGTYRDYVEAGALDADAPEETYTEGTWKLEGDILTETTKEGNVIKAKIIWKTDDHIYFDESDGTAEVPEEEIDEMGWYRRKNEQK